MFRRKLKGLFEKTPVLHYIKQVETAVIGDIIVDVNNIILRPYACDGAHCLTMKSLPNHLDEYGFSFYNEVPAYGDCCRGPVVFLSHEERQRSACEPVGSMSCSIVPRACAGRTVQPRFQRCENEAVINGKVGLHWRIQP